MNAKLKTGCPEKSPVSILDRSSDRMVWTIAKNLVILFALVYLLVYLYTFLSPLV